jgi:hypothetical protein
MQLTMLRLAFLLSVPTTVSLQHSAVTGGVADFVSRSAHRL